MQAIVNPEELETFARMLQQFNSDLNDSTRRLGGQFARLGETWRDQNHQKFAAEFEQTVRNLQHFMRAADEEIPQVRSQATAIRDYLSRS